MDEDDGRIDPRYDPAFQRGFEGEVKSGPRGRTAVRRSAIVAPAPFREAADAVAEDQIPVGQVEARVTRSATPASADDDDSRHFARPAMGMARRMMRNPFMIALAVLGTVLVAIGIAWLNQIGVVTGVAGASTEGDYWFLEASVFGAPLTIALGVAIWTGLLFMFARAWNRA
jgi:hypothetical protein